MPQIFKSRSLHAVGLRRDSMSGMVGSSTRVQELFETESVPMDSASTFVALHHFSPHQPLYGKLQHVSPEKAYTTIRCRWKSRLPSECEFSN